MRIANLFVLLLSICAAPLAFAASANAAVMLDRLATATQEVSPPPIRVGCAGGDFGPQCSLSELLNNKGSIQIGDKLFDGWEFKVSEGNVPPALLKNIKLTEIDRGLRARGFLFDMRSPLPFSVRRGESLLANISYAVTVVATDELAIVGNDLTLVVGGLAANNSVHKITEFLSNGVIKEVVAAGQRQHKDFDPTTVLGVSTNIELFGGNRGGSGTRTFVSSYEQTFMQNPLPAPILLLGSSMLGLAAAAWGKRRRK